MIRTRIFAAAIVLLFALSCQKEELLSYLEEGEEIQQLTYSLKSENAGGVVTCIMDAPKDFPLKWEDKDEIMLYGETKTRKRGKPVCFTQKLTLATTGTASAETGIIDGADPSKFTFVKSEEWETVCAVYPYSACVERFNPRDPQLNFGGQDGSLNKANICAAKEYSGRMYFVHAGAILRFASKPVQVMNVLLPIDLTSFQFGFNSSFNVILRSIPAWEENAAYQSHTYEVNLNNTTGPVYIGVPYCRIDAGSEFKYRSASRGVFKTYTSAETEFCRGKVYNLGDITFDGSEPDMSFTVGSGPGKVCFSGGNLYCNTSTTPVTYNFEANQYDYRSFTSKHPTSGGFFYLNYGAAFIEGKPSKTPANTVGSFFFFSTDSNAYAQKFPRAPGSEYLFTNDQTTETSPNSDLTVYGSKGFWRSLTGGDSGEWKYLLATRTVNGGTGEGHSYQRTILTLADKRTTVYGMIIVPDKYTGPLSAATSWSAWQAMESAGCVFLPAAGRRNIANAEYAGSVGIYGSSTSRDHRRKNEAYCLLFRDDLADPNYCIHNSYGRSIRLVYDTR